MRAFFIGWISLDVAAHRDTPARAVLRGQAFHARLRRQSCSTPIASLSTIALREARLRDAGASRVRLAEVAIHDFGDPGGGWSDLCGAIDALRRERTPMNRSVVAIG